MAGGYRELILDQDDEDDCWEMEGENADGKVKENTLHSNNADAAAAISNSKEKNCDNKNKSSSVKITKSKKNAKSKKSNADDSSDHTTKNKMTTNNTDIFKVEVKNEAAESAAAGGKKNGGWLSLRRRSSKSEDDNRSSCVTLTFSFVPPLYSDKCQGQVIKVDVPNVGNIERSMNSDTPSSGSERNDQQFNRQVADAKNDNIEITPVSSGQTNAGTSPSVAADSCVTSVTIVKRVSFQGESSTAKDASEDGGGGGGNDTQENASNSSSGDGREMQLVACCLTPVEDREWIHPPESLMKHSTSYNAKFLGTADVDEATGIETVKEAVVKIKFSNQLKLSEGWKPAKVQIVISLDGISIVDDKTRDILHFRPLNAISYCADDKTDKGIFTFIAKYPDSNQHSCFVFESEKLAEEITATIGQTFDLAYQKLVESSSQDANMKKQFVSLQKRIQDLMLENGNLKKRISTLETLVDPMLLQDTENKKRHNSLDTQKSMSLPRQMSPHVKAASLSSSSEENITTHKPYRQSSSPAKIQLARSSLVTKSVSSSPSTPPLLAPPPPPPRTHRLSLASSSSTDQDIFSSPPFSPSPTAVRGASPTSSLPSPPAVPPRSTFTSDPFDMGIFTPPTLNTKVAAADWSFPVLQSPLLQSTYNPISDFSLNELDPLRCK